VPIAALLKRAVENPEVANALPRTVGALSVERAGRAAAEPSPPSRPTSARCPTAPTPAPRAAPQQRVAGARSLVMTTYKALPLEGARRRPTSRRSCSRSTSAGPTRLLAGDRQERLALDRRLPARLGRPARDAQGAVERMPPDQRVFGGILARTFGISAVVTPVVPAARLSRSPTGSARCRRAAPTC
jgi:putative spermidine/putrescine transport system permease protein